MKIGSKSTGCAVLTLALAVVSGCGGGNSSSTNTGGGGGTPTPNACTSVSGSSSNQWTWVCGSNSPAVGGSYGTEGTASATNVPASRQAAASWMDSSGNFWLFGGLVNPSSSAPTFANDLWKYSPSSNQWTWVSGTSSANQGGTYGTINVAATANVPGARYEAATWRDTSGNLYLFGGIGLDRNGASIVAMNDLWKYNITSNQWTWIGGANTGANPTLAATPGVYGTLGVAASSNQPGERWSASSWTDSSGNFWLFGGQGADSTGTVVDLSDLWKYTPSTNLWTWVAGSNTSANVSNTPAGRYSATAWIDSSNNLWLFGGSQGTPATQTSAGTFLPLVNDLWKFSSSTGQWTAVTPSNTSPVARAYAVSWTDSSNNLWLFGGSDGTNVYNDLWKYSISSNVWTKLNGGSATNGTYGTQGTSAAGNIPSGRIQSSTWIDSSGNLWLFGGEGYGASASGNSVSTLNDLWRYQP